MIKKPERRPPLYLLTGVVLGLMSGLLIAWIFPAVHVGVSPASLGDEYKDQYRLTVALAYAATGDIGRAQARLALLEDGDPVRALATQAQLALANSATQREARALASLASDLDTLLDSQQATAAAVNTPNPDQQGEISTPIQHPAEGAVYFVDNQELLCESSQTPPMVKLFVFDANHNAQAGVEITITWAGNEEIFFTGEKPEFGPGYAEFILEPNVVYTLAVQGTELIGGLKAAACETDEGEPAWGAWLFLFNAEE